MKKIFDLSDIRVACNKTGVSIMEIDSLQFYKEEHTCLVGNSGAGKSTILKLLNRFVSPQRGVVKYLNRAIMKYDYISLRRDVLYLNQRPILLGETARESFSVIEGLKVFDNSFNEGEVKSYFEKLLLDEDIFDKSILSLSGGEKQKIAIVRALLFRPKILLLDEPTTALDKDSIEALIKLVREIKNITIISVSHNESWMNLNSRIITLKKGKIENDRLLKESVC